jgi:hypothetical protein
MSAIIAIEILELSSRKTWMRGVVLLTLATTAARFGESNKPKAEGIDHWIQGGATAAPPCLISRYFNHADFPKHLGTTTGSGRKP